MTRNVLLFSLIFFFVTSWVYLESRLNDKIRSQWWHSKQQLRFWFSKVPYTDWRMPYANHGSSYLTCLLFSAHCTGLMRDTDGRHSGLLFSLFNLAALMGAGTNLWLPCIKIIEPTETNSDGADEALTAS